MKVPRTFLDPFATSKVHQFPIVLFFCLFSFSMPGVATPITLQPTPNTSSSSSSLGFTISEIDTKIKIKLRTFSQLLDLLEETEQVLKWFERIDLGCKLWMIGKVKCQIANIWLPEKIKFYTKRKLELSEAIDEAAKELETLTNLQKSFPFSPR